MKGTADESVVAFVDASSWECSDDTLNGVLVPQQQHEMENRRELVEVVARKEIPRAVTAVAPMAPSMGAALGRNRRMSMPALVNNMHFDNPDLMRLIASSMSVRKVGFVEDRMKLLRRLNECPEIESGDGKIAEKKPIEANNNTVENGASAATDDDETMSPEEEAAARAAVQRTSVRSGVPRRSVQYDNPELSRLASLPNMIGGAVGGVSSDGVAAIRKGSIVGGRKNSLARGGSFSDERMSYRTALEKLMPSSMVNEYELEESVADSLEAHRDSLISTSSSTLCPEDAEKAREAAALHSTVDSICKMFEQSGKVHVNKFLNALTETGIRMSDPRLNDSMQKLKRILRRMGSDFDSSNNCLMDSEDFKKLIQKDAPFMHRILRTNFVIPEWQEFCRHVFALYSSCKKNTGGKVSAFIPQLADYDPNLWAVSVCSVDGQRFSAGDAEVPFSLQACCRVLNYAIVLNDHGADRVHSFVGQEPSGRDIRELFLDENDKPHNPMINAGAIVVTSLVKDTHRHMADRFEAISEVYSKMAGKEHLGFSNTSYLSERQISYRNYALGYFLRENKCFPPNAQLNDTMELLLQLYSTEVTCESLAVMAATLANGGICPTTGEQVISSTCVRDVLSLMYSCGMNDYSGKFAFHVGLPARSSISGAIMLVVPNVMGICLWSPPLDQYENSVRGVQFCTELIKTFNFHNYDNLRFTQRKLDPRRTQVESRTQQVVLTLFSAANGDITALRRFLLQGVDLTQADYDGRTPLHVAASEGHIHCVKFLLQKARVPGRPLDRWQNTPADDARADGFDEIADYLDQWNALVEQQRRTARPRFSVPTLTNTAANAAAIRPQFTCGPPKSIIDDCMSDYESGDAMSHIESAQGSPL